MVPGADADLPAFWSALGVPGAIDVHVHFMPARVQDKVWTFFDELGTGGDDLPRWPVRYRSEDAVRVRQLGQFGVRRFGTLAYAHRRGMAAWLNTWLAEFAARTPGAIHSATFHAEPGVDHYVASALETGAQLWKVHLQVGGFDPRDPVLRPVWARLAAAGVPVIVHCGSGPQPGTYTGPEIFGEVLAAHPDLVAVIAHMGLPEYGAFLDLADRYPGVYLDTTMVFTDFVERFAPFPGRLLPRLGALADRVVLGSDFPNIPYAYAHQIEALARLDLGAEWLRSVVWHNPGRLLGGDAAAWRSGVGR